jgi:hypothetical protein
MNSVHQFMSSVSYRHSVSTQSVVQSGGFDAVKISIATEFCTEIDFSRVHLRLKLANVIMLFNNVQRGLILHTKLYFTTRGRI